jgi:endonuclease/exonuclease/phosphatase family metal-dependent hydrolase
MTRRICRLMVRLGLALLFGSVADPVFGQTSVVLQAPDTQVTDTTIRGGTYAKKNLDGTVLASRASSNEEYRRRALLKFDTQNTISAGTSIASATLTLRVKTGSEEATRTVGAYYVKNSFEEADATWVVRKGTTAWTTKGGDYGAQYASASVSNVPGATVTFDLTKLVQDAVNGALGSSRYTRVALLDNGTSTSASYREYYHSETADPSLRPTLTVVLGAAPAPAPEPTPDPGTATSLRVLHWNIHHGVGTDGKYDIDRLATWMAKFTPDIISMNEVEKYSGAWGNEDQPARFASLLKTKTGKTWYYYFGNRDGGTGNGQGNLILSVFPIEDKETLQLSYNRSAVKGRVTVNGRTVTMISTHLDHASSTYRQAQINELKPWAATEPEQRIIAGDFNAQSTSTNITTMTADYDDSWARAKSLGVAYTYPDNPSGATRNSRIDYIFESKGATRLALTRAEVFDTRDANGYMPSDHKPLMAVFDVN